MDTKEFLQHARLDNTTLETWIDAGWLMPKQGVDPHQFFEIDVARVGLIRDLREDLGVNDEGISIILDLLDQLHGVRRTLTTVLSVSATRAELTIDRGGSAEDPRPVAANLKRRRRIDEEQAL